MATYTGSCHCGAVQFDVTLDLNNLATCNCSICGRSGSIMAFVPQKAFHLRKGEDAQTDYQFGKKRIHHLFCTTCGVRSFGSPLEPGENGSMMINVRCLDGVDVHTLNVAQKYDGKSL